MLLFGRGEAVRWAGPGYARWPARPRVGGGADQTHRRLVHWSPGRRARQAVLLRGGYDSRAFRLPEAQAVSVLEVDHRRPRPSSANSSPGMSPPTSRAKPIS
ncbi:class I SAM-dependent methyltransferase [Streptomyces sp. Inha503]|uniref:class I SAM-dependent methyltransferase n=1 Tax=Streptomyces sp. Inha503 TaxID=3383314 RepID=UPI0039A00005